MLSNENLKVVDIRQQDLKVNDKLFGGINVVLLGDIIHLTKVAGALFTHHISEQEVLSAQVLLFTILIILSNAESSFFLNTRTFV